MPSEGKGNMPKLYAKNKTAENYELKKKYRNLATKERRKAIKEFWMKKTDDLKQKPWEFFKRDILTNSWQV